MSQISFADAEQAGKRKKMSTGQEHGACDHTVRAVQCVDGAQKLMAMMGQVRLQTA